MEPSIACGPFRSLLGEFDRAAQQLGHEHEARRQGGSLAWAFFVLAYLPGELAANPAFGFVQLVDASSAAHRRAVLVWT